MKKALLALGSDHGDDQVGWLLLDQLSLVDDFRYIDALKIAAPALSLFQQLQQYDQVLIVDAADSGLEPGTSQFYADSSGFLHMSSQPLSSHNLSLKEALALLKALDLPVPQIGLFLVQIKQTETMQPLSTEIAQQLPALVIGLEQCLRNFFSLQ